MATATRSRTAARIVGVRAVDRTRVCDRLTRVKSSNRSRSTTVRPSRPALRIRPVTRSTSPMTTASISAIGAGRGPSRAANRSNRRRLPTCTRARIAVVGQRVQVPAGRLTQDGDQPGLVQGSATWPTV